MVKTLLHMELGPRTKLSSVTSMLSALPELLNQFFEHGTTVALLLTRPGKGPVSHADSQWAGMLTDMAAEFGVPIEPIFRANDASLVQVVPPISAAS